MEVEKGEWKILQRAIDEWERSGKITKEQAHGLKETIDYTQSERQQIAQYFFFIALFCTLLAFGAIFLNEKLLEKIKLYFSWNDIIIALVLLLFCLYYGFGISAEKERISVRLHMRYTWCWEGFPF